MSLLNKTKLYLSKVIQLPDEWDDYKNYHLTHITCLNALAIVGNELINENYLAKSQQPDLVRIASKLLNLGEIDWSASGDLKFVKGLAGTKMLADDIRSCLSYHNLQRNYNLKRKYPFFKNAEYHW